MQSSLYCSRIISNKLEQLYFKLENIIGIEKHAGKVRKGTFLFWEKWYDLDIFVYRTLVGLECLTIAGNQKKISFLKGQ